MQNTKQVLDWDNKDIFKRKRELYLDEDLVDKIDSIEYGAQVNKIEEIEVNWVPVEPDVSKTIHLNIPRVIDALTSDSSTDALSARMWKYLYSLYQQTWTLYRYRWSVADRYDIFVTRSEYNALPSSKLTDWNSYFIIDKHGELMEIQEMYDLYLNWWQEACVQELNTHPQWYFDKYDSEWLIDFRWTLIYNSTSLAGWSSDSHDWWTTK